jgi:thymidylate kinase
MDLRLSNDWFECFVKYQNRMEKIFRGFQEKYDFEVINADRSLHAIQKDLRERMERVLAGFRV